MESTPGNDLFSFPISKSPQLEVKLLEMPKKIRDLETSLCSLLKTQELNNIRIRELENSIKDEVISELTADHTLVSEEELFTAIDERLLASMEYQGLIMKRDCNDKNLKAGAVERTYLNNLFKAYQSLARML